MTRYLSPSRVALRCGMLMNVETETQNVDYRSILDVITETAFNNGQGYKFKEYA